MSAGSQHSDMAVAGSVKPASAASVGAAAQDPAHPTACQEGEPQVPEPGALSSAHSAEVCPGDLATEAGADASLSGAEEQAEENACAPGAPAGHELAAATGSQERQHEQCKGAPTDESALPSHKAASMDGMPALPAAQPGKDMQPGTTCTPLQAAAQPSDPAATHTGADAAAQLTEDTDMPQSQAAASREVHMEEPALAVTRPADAAKVDRGPVTPQKAGMVMNTALKAPTMAAEGGQVGEDPTVAADEAATGAKQTSGNTGAEKPTQLAGVPLKPTQPASLCCKPMQPIDGAAACAAQTTGNTGGEEPTQLASLCHKPTLATDGATAFAEQTAGKPDTEESMQLASLCLKPTQLTDGAAACIEQTPAKDASEDPTQLASLCRKPPQATVHTVMPHSEGAFGSPLAAPVAETQLVLRPHRTGHAAREHPHTGQPKAAARAGVPASSGPNSGPVLKPAPMATSVLTAALGKRLVTSTSRPTGGWFGGSSSNPYATPKPRGATLGSLPRSHAPAQRDTLLATRVTSLRPAAASPFVCTPAQTSAGVAGLNVAASPKTATALGMVSNAAPLAKQAAANSAGMASSTLASCTKAHTLVQRAGPTASSLPGHAPAPPAAPQASHPAVDIPITAADGQPVAGSCMLPPQPHKPTQAPGPNSPAGAQALLLPDLPVDVRPKKWSSRHDLVLVHVQLRLGRRPQAAAAVGRLLRREARAWTWCWMLLGRPA